MGGMVAQELRRGAPPVGVHGLVLACTSPAFGKPGGDWQAQFLAERLAPLDAGLGMAGLAPQLVPGMVAPGGAARWPCSVAAAVMSAVPEATYRAALRPLSASTAARRCRPSRVPTLCLAGEHDRNAPPAVMQRMAARIPGAEYHCLPGAGHLANVEAAGGLQRRRRVTSCNGTFPVLLNATEPFRREADRSTAYRRRPQPPDGAAA